MTLNLATVNEHNLNFPRTLSFLSRHAYSYTPPTLIHRSLQQLTQVDTGTSGAVKMGLGGHLANPSGIFLKEQNRTVQIVAIVAAIFSITACLTTVYWFFMMRRNFRRQ